MKAAEGSTITRGPMPANKFRLVMRMRNNPLTYLPMTAIGSTSRFQSIIFTFFFWAQERNSSISMTNEGISVMEDAHFLGMTGNLKRYVTELLLLKIKIK